MIPNFVVRKNGEEILTADKMDWISYTHNERVGMKMQTSPSEGYCMVTDMQTPNIESLDLKDLKSSTVESSWTFRTEPIDRLIENTREYVKFEIGEDTYEVDIRVNNAPKPRTAPVGPFA